MLADDHGIIRDMLRRLLSSEPDVDVVGEASDGGQAVALAAEVMPDVVVMDLTMPGLDGVEATRRITAAGGVRVVVLSGFTGPRRVGEAMAAGASAFVAKGEGFAELLAAVRAAASGGSYVGPLCADALGRAVRGGSAPLTPRELEVLRLMAGGYATKEIAYRLSISVKTVETHRRLLMEKLNLDSVAAVTRYALREGLTDAGGAAVH